MDALVSITSSELILRAFFYGAHVFIMYWKLNEKKKERWKDVKTANMIQTQTISKTARINKNNNTTIEYWKEPRHERVSEKKEHTTTTTTNKLILNEKQILAYTLIHSPKKEKYARAITSLNRSGSFQFVSLQNK